MPKNFNSKTFYRIIDANINRTQEGLRVLEEITRFILNNRILTSKLKNIRHNLVEIINKLAIDKYRLIEERDSAKDIGKDILAKETHRNSYLDIVLANLGRVKESIRALEEFSKLINRDIAIKFKNIRYAVYDIEKKIVKKLKALRT